MMLSPPFLRLLRLFPLLSLLILVAPSDPSSAPSSSPAILYEDSCTGMLRVCLDGEDPSTALPPCAANVLGRKTIRISGRDWASSTYEAWIAMILLSEQMQIPVIIETPSSIDRNGRNASKQYYWHYEGGKEDDSAEMSYGDGLYHAYVDPTCKSVPEPCIHVDLEVWIGDEAETANFLKNASIFSVGPTGWTGKEGWFASSAFLETHPNSATYPGLVSGENTKFFKYARTFAEHCIVLYDEEEAGDGSSSSSSSSSSLYSGSFCSWFFTTFLVSHSPHHVPVPLPSYSDDDASALLLVLKRRYLSTSDVLAALPPSAAALFSASPFASSASAPYPGDTVSRLSSSSSSGEVGVMNGPDPCKWWTRDAEIILNGQMSLEVVDMWTDGTNVDAWTALGTRNEPFLTYLWTPHEHFERGKYEGEAFDLAEVVLKPYKSKNQVWGPCGVITETDFGCKSAVLLCS